MSLSLKQRTSSLVGNALAPAEPLWRVAPTRDTDGRYLADFMMLIPGLSGRTPDSHRYVETSIREVCESYGDQVIFADINYAINVLWVSVAAKPGLAASVAQSIRGRVPEALLVGGQLGATTGLSVSSAQSGFWRKLVRRVSRRTGLRLDAPR